MINAVTTHFINAPPVMIVLKSSIINSLIENQFLNRMKLPLLFKTADLKLRIDSRKKNYLLRIM
jgi:hypothetical protein